MKFKKADKYMRSLTTMNLTIGEQECISKLVQQMVKQVHDVVGYDVDPRQLKTLQWLTSWKTQLKDKFFITAERL